MDQDPAESDSEVYAWCERCGIASFAEDEAADADQARIAYEAANADYREFEALYEQHFEPRDVVRGKTTDGTFAFRTDGPTIQSGQLRDTVITEDGTVYHRSRPGVHANEPSAMRFQASRPLSNTDMDRAAQIVGYIYPATVAGERLGNPVRDTPNSFTLSADITKSRRDDVDQALSEFEQHLPEMFKDGSPVRTIDHTGAGTRGTRLIPGFNEEHLTFHLFYDSVTED
jgi:hypothetical protein